MTVQEKARNVGRQIFSAESAPEVESVRGRRFVRVFRFLTVPATFAFLLLAVQAHTKHVLQIDLTVERAIQGIHLPVYDWVLTHVSDLGYFPGTVITYAVVVVVLYLLNLRLAAALAVGSSLLASLAGSFLRMLVGRPRPSASLVHVATHVTSFGFPSGHVIHYTTLFGFCFYIVLTTWRSSLPRNLMLMVLSALVVLVGPSRVYLGAHWPSDVLGGYLFGTVWLTGTVELYRRLVVYLGTSWSPLPVPARNMPQRTRQDDRAT